MTVFILDNGLSDPGSHSLNLALSVGRALLAAEMDFEIYCHAGADANVIKQTGAIPHFSRSLYDGEGKDPSLWEIDSWLVLNQFFHDDLCRLPDRVASRNSIVVIPAISQHQVLGFARWIHELPPARRPKVVVQLMFSPNWTVWGAVAPLGHLFYRNALDLIASLIGTTVFLCSENEDTAQVYRRLSGHEVSILPVPTINPKSSSSPRRESDVLNLSFLGYSKMEKGFHLLPEAIRICVERGLPVRFLVHVHHSGWEAETVKADKDIAESKSALIYRGAIDQDAYFEILGATDIVLLPYDPMQYRTRGSGVFSEAVAYGKPVVGSPGTWMDAASRRGECAAVIFDTYNAASFADAITEASRDFARLKAQAQASARAWRERNSGANYLRTVLSLCGKRENAPSRAQGPCAGISRVAHEDAVDYRLGTRLTFGAGSEGARFLRSDAALEVEGDSVWLDRAVDLTFRINDATADLVVIIEALSVAVVSSVQKLDVLANGVLIGSLAENALNGDPVRLLVGADDLRGTSDLVLTLRPAASVVVKSNGIRRRSVKILGLSLLGTDETETYFAASALGKTYQFCIGATAGPRLIEGWSSRESTLCWAIEPRATLALRPTSSAGNVVLSLDVGVPAGHGVGQFLTVSLGGRVLGKQEVVSSLQRLTFPVPDELWTEGMPLFMVLETNRSFTVNEDPRLLRLSLVALTFQEEPVAAARLPVNEELSFGLDGAAQVFAQEGWSVPEPGWCWMNDSHATMVFSPQRAVSGAELRLRVTTLASAKEPLRLSFTLDQQPVGGIVLTDGYSSEIVLSRLTLAANRAHELRISADRTFQALGDSRNLVACFHSLSLHETSR